MATPTFFYNNTLSSGTTVTLPDHEAAHATKARRLALGASIQLINGQGDLATGCLAHLSKKQVNVDVTHVVHTPKPASSLTIATAIPKGDRQKVMLDMLTQLGVAQIVPLACEFSVSRFSANMQDKWQRVCIEACKQSQRVWLPTITAVMTPSECVEHYKQAGFSLAYADAGEGNQKRIDEVPHRVILIGPEGGFSESECALFKSNDCIPLALAEHILRTETASVAAAARLFTL